MQDNLNALNIAEKNFLKLKEFDSETDFKCNVMNTIYKIYVANEYNFKDLFKTF